MTTKIIADRYALYEELGSGGMGTVYRGIDRQTEQNIAIKHLRPEMADAEQIARFKREGLALRELNHPNIVKMWDAIEEDGNYYIILDYVVGGDLSEILKTGKLSAEKTVSMCIDVADALTRAHKLGIIHRDLKPANVLIAEDGTLRLTDFGIAHIVSQDTMNEADMLVGTIDYIAPEALQGKDTSTSMDIWAFGIMLFEMLTQKRPFNRGNVTETLMAITQDPVPDLAELCHDIPDELEDLIYRMLERDTYRRISSVRHVGAILEDIQQGRSTSKTNLINESRFEGISDTKLSIKRNNLPEQLTEFVGREAEIQEIQRILPTTRLVTILAPGGMGKTRLSLEIARLNLGAYREGVYFVELAGLSEASAILPAVAEAVNCSLTDAKGSEEKFLFDFIGHKSILLVMDNYEHLMDGAGFVGKLLSQCANLTIIATSRKRLNQAGEILFRLGGMDFPDWETPEDASNYTAVKLFMGSAKHVRSDFELSVNNLPYLARICRLVQGMPLAIVLSAGWLVVLEPAEIADEIAQGIDFLEADGGNLPERQRSIRAVFDYAWHMISEADRDTFMALSIFHAGFTREAAQAVAGATIRQLMKLVNLSLLQRDTDSGRYHIHELLRQYVDEKLQASGQYEPIRAKHARYYGERVYDIYTDLVTGKIYTSLFGQVEFENLKLAMLWDIQYGNGDVTGKLINGLLFWVANSVRSDEIGKLITKAYDTFKSRDIADADRARIISFYGIQQGYGKHNFALSNKMLDKGISILEQIEDYTAVAIFNLNRIQLDIFQGNIGRAKKRASDGYNLSKEHHLTPLMAQASSFLGYIATTIDDNLDEGKKWYLETLDLAKPIDNKATIALAHFNLSNIYYLENNIPATHTHVEEAFDLCKVTGNIRLRCYVGDILARLHILEGDLDQAEAILRESVILAKNSQQKQTIILSIHFLHLFYLYVGRYDDSIAIFKQRDELAPPEHETELNRLVNALPLALALWGAGNREEPVKTIEQAVVLLANKVIPTTYIYALLGMALIWASRTQYKRSLAMLGLLKAHINWVDIGDGHAMVQTLENTLKQQFSEDEYETIFQDGAKRDYREIVNALVAELASDS